MAIVRPEGTRDLPAYSAVPQPTAPPRAPIFHWDGQNKRENLRPIPEIMSVLCSNHIERFRFITTFIIDYCDSRIFHNRVPRRLNDIACLPSYAPP